MFDRIIEKLYIKNGAELAFKDKATGAYNRNWYEHNLHNFVHEDFDLIIIDINMLKNINDELGHSMGDEIISIIVHMLQAIFHHKDDYVIRWGGDEFVIFTKYEYEVDIVKSMPIRYFSYGITHHVSGEDIDTSFKEADIELYNMKKIYHESIKEK